jgi:hypothetical protein
MHIKISGFKIHLEADLIFENDKIFGQCMET